ncbi:hypothetical protein ACQCQ7_24770 [Ralstonia pseudosolanacearum]|uniref:hypothetical protein n=1 Tax=Ralstonia pseudosolanacearum TaxID=1310165 RepID=UPI003CE6772B
MTRTDMAPAMAEGGMPPVGEHLLLDLYGVSPALLRDAALLESTLRGKLFWMPTRTAPGAWRCAPTWA